MHSVGNIKPTTDGENLFFLLNEMGHKITSGRTSLKADRIKMSGRDEYFGEYLDGALLSFCFKRLMKLAHSIFGNPEHDVYRANTDLRRHLQSWFYWLKEQEIGILSRYLIRAQKASFENIHVDLRKEIFYKRSVHTCCFCGCRLSADSNGIHRDPGGKIATLEHVWPQSLGGNSVKANLVPACQKCNQVKSDNFIWQQALVHDFVHPFNFSNDTDSYEKFPLQKKIVLQRRAIMVLAQRESLSLKSALLKIGPFGQLKAVDINDTWDFFNIENHSESIGENLW